MGDTKTYDPKFVALILGGVPITGFADGTFISVAPSTDIFTKVVGADGQVARARSNDDTATVTITLMQTSLSNDYLSGLMTLDRLSNTGKVPIQIKDLLGTTLFFSSSAWVQTKPTVEFSKEIGERTWVLATGQADIEVIGGNI